LLSVSSLFCTACNSAKSSGGEDFTLPAIVL
jgi:hypothetical protein